MKKCKVRYFVNTVFWQLTAFVVTNVQVCVLAKILNQYPFF